MRQAPRSRIVGLALFALAALVALAGMGASLGHEAQAPPVAAAEAAATQVDQGGLVADLALDVHALGLHASPAQHVDPAQARSLTLPSLEVSRQASLPTSAAPLSLDASLGLATGGKAVRSTSASAPRVGVETQASTVLPASSPALLAAAALAGAGLLAYFWTGAMKLVVLPVVALYAKISRAEVFENEVRERIFAQIKATPGLCASELARLAGVAWGTTIYHLDVLEQTRMATSIREGRHRRYFENGAVLTTSKETISLLRNPVTSSVAERVRGSPGLTQKDLASATGLSPQALHWHLARLVGAGLVRKERQGRVVRHYAA